jgi:ribosome maturation factor RimP
LQSKTSEGKAAEIESLIAPSLQAMGYDIVRIIISGRHDRLLQIMAERSLDGGMGVDDCAAVSRAVSAILDVEDPIPRAKDFERYAGFEARVEMAAPVDGRRRFTGRLRGLSDADVLIETAEGERRLAFEEIAKAKLVLTDELIAASRAAGGEGAETNQTEA